MALGVIDVCIVDCQMMQRTRRPPELLGQSCRSLCIHIVHAQVQKLQRWHNGYGLKKRRQAFVCEFVVFKIDVTDHWEVFHGAGVHLGHSIAYSVMLQIQMCVNVSTDYERGQRTNVVLHDDMMIRLAIISLHLFL